MMAQIAPSSRGDQERSKEHALTVFPGGQRTSELKCPGVHVSMLFKDSSECLHVDIEADKVRILVESLADCKSRMMLHETEIQQLKANAKKSVEFPDFADE